MDNAVSEVHPMLHPHQLPDRKGESAKLGEPTVLESGKDGMGGAYNIGVGRACRFEDRTGHASLLRP